MTPSCTAMAPAFEVKLGPAIARVHSSVIQSSTALTSPFVVYNNELNIISNVKCRWSNSPVFSSPSFHKRHANRAHSRQLVNGLKALRNWLRQKRSKFLVVEYLQVAAGWNFTDRRRMPTVAWITVRTLHKDAGVAETFGKHLAADVVQADTFADVPSRLFHYLVSVHVRQEAEAEAFGVWGIGETIDGDWRLWSVESFTNAKIQLVVTYRAPERWVLIHHRRCFERLWGRQMREAWNRMWVN